MTRKSGLLLHQREAAILFNITISELSSVLSPFYIFFLITVLFIHKSEAALLNQAITVATRCIHKQSSLARSNSGIVGSNPTEGMVVCVRLFCVCVVLCVGSGLATGSSPVRGLLPTVYRIKKPKKKVQGPTKKIQIFVSQRKGRAIAQAVSRRLPTAAVRVQNRVWSCGIL
jgi:hypothetical protein